MIEVEKKCRLQNPDRILKFLEEKAVFKKENRKEDIYYIKRTSTTDEKTLTTADKIFRIRYSNNKYYVTFKEKIVADGAEINDEEEFEIEDAVQFKKFANYIGFEKLVEKVKEVKLFSYRDISLEYNYLHKLGYFLEAEVICENNAEVQTAINIINQVFDELAIDKNDIEEKMYIELLLEQQ